MSGRVACGKSADSGACVSEHGHHQRQNVLGNLQPSMIFLQDRRFKQQLCVLCRWLSRDFSLCGTINTYRCGCTFKEKRVVSLLQRNDASFAPKRSRFHEDRQSLQGLHESALGCLFTACFAVRQSNNCLLDTFAVLWALCSMSRVSPLATSLLAVKQLSQEDDGRKATEIALNRAEDLYRG